VFGVAPTGHRTGTSRRHGDEHDPRPATDRHSSTVTPDVAIGSVITIASYKLDLHGRSQTWLFVGPNVSEVGPRPHDRSPPVVGSGWAASEFVSEVDGL
jgi:hypothetical protein